jgi:hypothetical protein
MSAQPGPGPDPDLLQHHPAVDLATPTAAVVVQERAVVGLEPLLLDALVSATRAGVPLQLVTPPESRLTVPLARALRGTGGRWVVRRADTSCFDGLVGRTLVWDGSCFTDPVDGPAVDPGWASAEPSGSGSLSVELTVVHPATRDLLLGESTETCTTVLAGAAPTGWGVAEPVTQPWDRVALSALCRDRAPASATLVVVGGTPDRRALGTTTVSRTTGGVREELALQVGGGLEPDVHRFNALAERLAAQTTPPRTALLGLAPGRDDGTVAARATGGVVPCGLLLGPSVVAEVGRERAQSAPASWVRLLGPDSAPSLWVHLVPAAGRVNPGGTLGRVLRHLGVTLSGA